MHAATHPLMVPSMLTAPLVPIGHVAKVGDHVGATRGRLSQFAGDGVRGRLGQCRSRGHQQQYRSVPETRSRATRTGAPLRGWPVPAKPCGPACARPPPAAACAYSPSAVEITVRTNSVSRGMNPEKPAGQHEDESDQDACQGAAVRNRPHDAGQHSEADRHHPGRQSPCMDQIHHA